MTLPLLEPGMFGAQMKLVEEADRTWVRLTLHPLGEGPEITIEIDEGEFGRLLLHKQAFRVRVWGPQMRGWEPYEPV